MLTDVYSSGSWPDEEISGSDHELRSLGDRKRYR
jgi:hypothetical protein